MAGIETNNLDESQVSICGSGKNPVTERDSPRYAYRGLPDLNRSKFYKIMRFAGDICRQQRLKLLVIDR